MRVFEVFLFLQGISQDDIFGIMHRHALPKCKIREVFVRRECFFSL